MKNIFCLSLFLLSFSLFSQSQVEMPIVTKSDTFRGKFRKVEIRGYYVKDTLDGIENSEPAEVVTITFYHSGIKRSVERKSQPETGAIVQTIYYNRKGKIEEITNKSGKELLDHTEYYYRKDGKLDHTSLWVYETKANRNWTLANKSGGVDSIYKTSSERLYSNRMIYDKNGRLDSILTYAEKIITGIHNYDYDENGNRILDEVIYTNEKDSLPFQYDQNGKLIYETYYRINYDSLAGGKYYNRTVLQTYVTHYVYLETGMMKVRTIPIGNGNQTDTSWYSFKGVLLLNVWDQYMKDRNDNVTGVTSRNTYLYDQNGFLTSYTNKKIGEKDKAKLKNPAKYMNKPPYVETYIILYDRRGNPVKCYSDNAYGKMVFEWKYF
jgi:hypothetical protein